MDTGGIDTRADRQTKGIPSDYYTMSQWQLTGEWGLRADRVWNDYTGTGVILSAIDDGFQYTHPELSANYRTDLDWNILNGTPDAAPAAGNNHGTAVLGTMIADDNGFGMTGVAFDASGFGVRIGFDGNTSLADVEEAFYRIQDGGADVVNNSWGFTSPFGDDVNNGTGFYAIENAMRGLADDGRAGLGTSMVFAAGNSRAAGDSVNYHNLNASPYAIAVGAITQTGEYASFSNPGSALLVSTAGSGNYTIDRTGADGYVSGDYVSFSGTSAAAPVISGLIGLMLEANPNLGWRDVQEILAYSSRQNDAASGGWQFNGAGNWNGGGLHFNHDYGFGAADAYTAIRLAESWTAVQTSANMTTLSTATSYPALAIPETGTVTTTMAVAQSVSIEHILVTLDIAHSWAGDLIVTLISPEGTESILADHVSNGSFKGIYGVAGIDFEFMSNASWGENSLGTWTLKIEDIASGDSGLLNSWGLSFMGNAPSANNLYVFTDEFASFGGAALAQRSVITESNGGTDTINAAAVTGNLTIDLAAGKGVIAGQAVTFAQTLGKIENIFAGDGNDLLTGNASGNTIHGGRGADRLYGNEGSDILYGDAGADKIYGGIDSDKIYGGADSDSLFGDSGNDKLYGGASKDAMYGGEGNDSLYGEDGDDAMVGDAGNDAFSGGEGNDTIRGGDGSDRLSGDGGNDGLYGDDGNDYLIGGAGSDVLTGGAGSDQFVFTSLDGVDTVKDFALEDKLNITELLTGYEPEDEIASFVRLTSSSNQTIVSINQDGAGTDFTQAFSVYGKLLASKSAQMLFDSGILIVDQQIQHI